MDDTPNLKLPYIMAAQAQKHVTHNEAIRALDAIVQIGVADRDLTTPPASPTEGASYIVATGASGAWAGKDHKVAAWQDGAWAFYAPREGWIAWVADEDVLLAWDGTAWINAAGVAAGAFTDLSDAPASYSSAAGLIAVVKSDETGLEFSDQVPLLGVNATPDSTNKLAIASEASLFNHAGAGHQHKINKSSTSDTASLLFQTGFSGRAEFGTAGDDDLHLKVSPDGSTWIEAIVVDKDSGDIGFGTATPAARLSVIGGANQATALFHNNNTSGKTRLTIRGGSGQSNAGGTDPIISIRSSSNIQVGYIREDGLISSGYALATSDDSTGGLMDSSSEFSGTPRGLNLGQNAIAGWGSNQWWSSKDIGLSRISSGVLGVGDGTQGNVSGRLQAASVRVGSYTVAGVPSASTYGAGSMIYVSNESGGAVIAFSDGTNWRRVTDRAVIS